MRAAAQQALEALEALIDMDVAYRRGPVVEEAVETARAAIEALRTALAQPEGWQLVPKEPTKAMLFTGNKIMGCDTQWVDMGYRAMLAAAPSYSELTPV